MGRKQCGPSDAWTTGMRCWIEHEGKVVLGTGRADLLERIDQTRSIRAAAKDLAMSYRRAWLLVQSINDGAGEPLVETATGGKKGGGAVLTPRGRELLVIFRQLNIKLSETAATSLQSSFARPPSRRNVGMCNESANPPGQQTSHRTK